jgi:hypothetical protein
MQGDVALNRKCNRAATKPEVLISQAAGQIIRHVEASGHFHVVSVELLDLENIILAVGISFLCGTEAELDISEAEIVLSAILKIRHVGSVRSLPLHHQ